MQANNSKISFKKSPICVVSLDDYQTIPWQQIVEEQMMSQQDDKYFVENQDKLQNLPYQPQKKLLDELVTEDKQFIKYTKADLQNHDFMKVLDTLLFDQINSSDQYIKKDNSKINEPIKEVSPEEELDQMLSEDQHLDINLDLISEADAKEEESYLSLQGQSLQEICMTGKKIKKGELDLQFCSGLKPQIMSSLEKSASKLLSSFKKNQEYNLSAEFEKGCFSTVDTLQNKTIMDYLRTSSMKKQDQPQGVPQLAGNVSKNLNNMFDEVGEELNKNVIDVKNFSKKEKFESSKNFNTNKNQNQNQNKNEHKRSVSQPNELEQLAEFEKQIETQSQNSALLNSIKEQISKEEEMAKGNFSMSKSYLHFPAGSNISLSQQFDKEEKQKQEQISKRPQKEHEAKEARNKKINDRLKRFEITNFIDPSSKMGEQEGNIIFQDNLVDSLIIESDMIAQNQIDNKPDELMIQEEKVKKVETSQPQAMLQSSLFVNDYYEFQKEELLVNQSAAVTQQEEVMNQLKVQKIQQSREPLQSQQEEPIKNKKEKLIVNKEQFIAKVERRQQQPSKTPKKPEQEPKEYSSTNKNVGEIVQMYQDLSVKQSQKTSSPTESCFLEGQALNGAEVSSFFSKQGSDFTFNNQRQGLKSDSKKDKARIHAQIVQKVQNKKPLLPDEIGYLQDINMTLEEFTAQTKNTPEKFIASLRKEQIQVIEEADSGERKELQKYLLALRDCQEKEGQAKFENDIVEYINLMLKKRNIVLEPMDSPEKMDNSSISEEDEEDEASHDEDASSSGDQENDDEDEEKDEESSQDAKEEEEENKNENEKNVIEEPIKSEQSSSLQIYSVPKRNRNEKVYDPEGDSTPLHHGMSGFTDYEDDPDEPLKDGQTMLGDLYLTQQQRDQLMTLGSTEVQKGQPNKIKEEVKQETGQILEIKEEKAQVQVQAHQEKPKEVQVKAQIKQVAPVFKSGHELSLSDIPMSTLMASPQRLQLVSRFQEKEEITANHEQKEEQDKKKEKNVIRQSSATPMKQQLQSRMDIFNKSEQHSTKVNLFNQFNEEVDEELLNKGQQNEQVDQVNVQNEVLPTFGVKQQQVQEPVNELVKEPVKEIIKEKEAPPKQAVVKENPQNDKNFNKEKKIKFLSSATPMKKQQASRLDTFNKSQGPQLQSQLFNKFNVTASTKSPEVQETILQLKQPALAPEKQIEKVDEVEPAKEPIQNKNIDSKQAVQQPVQQAIQQPVQQVVKQPVQQAQVNEKLQKVKAESNEVKEITKTEKQETAKQPEKEKGQEVVAIINTQNERKIHSFCDLLPAMLEELKKAMKQFDLQDQQQIVNSLNYDEKLRSQYNNKDILQQQILNKMIIKQKLDQKTVGICQQQMLKSYRIYKESMQDLEKSLITKLLNIQDKFICWDIDLRQGELKPAVEADHEMNPTHLNHSVLKEFERYVVNKPGENLQVMHGFSHLHYKDLEEPYAFYKKLNNQMKDYFLLDLDFPIFERSELFSCNMDEIIQLNEKIYRRRKRKAIEDEKIEVLVQEEIAVQVKQVIKQFCLAFFKEWRAYRVQQQYICQELNAGIKKSRVVIFNKLGIDNLWFTEYEALQDFKDKQIDQFGIRKPCLNQSQKNIIQGYCSYTTALKDELTKKETELVVGNALLCLALNKARYQLGARFQEVNDLNKIGLIDKIELLVQCLESLKRFQLKDRHRKIRLMRHLRFIDEIQKAQIKQNEDQEFRVSDTKGYLEKMEVLASEADLRNTALQKQLEESEQEKVALRNKISQNELIIEQQKEELKEKDLQIKQFKDNVVVSSLNSNMANTTFNLDETAIDPNNSYQSLTLSGIKELGIKDEKDKQCCSCQKKGDNILEDQLVQRVIIEESNEEEQSNAQSCAQSMAQEELKSKKDDIIQDLQQQIAQFKVQIRDMVSRIDEKSKIEDRVDSVIERQKKIIEEQQQKLDTKDDRNKRSSSKSRLKELHSLNFLMSDAKQLSDDNVLEHMKVNLVYQNPDLAYTSDNSGWEKKDIVQCLTLLGQEVLYHRNKAGADKTFNKLLVFHAQHLAAYSKQLTKVHKECISTEIRVVREFPGYKDVILLLKNYRHSYTLMDDLMNLEFTLEEMQETYTFSNIRKNVHQGNVFAQKLEKKMQFIDELENYIEKNIQNLLSNNKDKNELKYELEKHIIENIKQEMDNSLMLLKKYVNKLCENVINLDRSKHPSPCDKVLKDFRYVINQLNQIFSIVFPEELILYAYKSTRNSTQIYMNYRAWAKQIKFLYTTPKKIDRIFMQMLKVQSDDNYFKKKEKIFEEVKIKLSYGLCSFIKNNLAEPSRIAASTFQKKYTSTFKKLEGVNAVRDKLVHQGNKYVMRMHQLCQLEQGVINSHNKELDIIEGAFKRAPYLNEKEQDDLCNKRGEWEFIKVENFKQLNSNFDRQLKKFSRIDGELIQFDSFTSEQPMNIFKEEEHVKEEAMYLKYHAGVDKVRGPSTKRINPFREPLSKEAEEQLQKEAREMSIKKLKQDLSPDFKRNLIKTQSMSRFEKSAMKSNIKIRPRR